MTQVQFPAVEKQYIASDGFAPVEARSQRVMSVHFERKEISFFHSKRRKFILEAASAENPTYCTFYDSLQAVQDTGHLMTREEGSREADMLFLARPVPLEVIIEDCLRNWCRYGIGISAKVPAGIIAIKGQSPTKDEMAKALKQEEALCRALVEEADTFFISKEGKIEERHRKALLWLGSERKPWFDEIRLGKAKTSPITGNRINMEALADGGFMLMEFYVANGLNPLDFGDEFVAAMWKSKPETLAAIKERLFASGKKGKNDSN